MKMPSILKPKKLNATAARRSRALGLPDGMDYEQMAEPNMKLSRALLIVLLLHIVAVTGIVAFNTIKTREAATTSTGETITPATEVSATPASAAASAVTAPNEITKVATQAQTKAPVKVAEKPKPETKTSGVVDSGKIYVVVKGDNPVTIARHLHVNYDTLLELNQIEDPRKLQIGQKLHIPVGTITTKHKSD
jgi:nucleoid-associated protein YgaU